jgi:hypothetical protein
MENVELSDTASEEDYTPKVGTTSRSYQNDPDLSDTSSTDLVNRYISVILIFSKYSKLDIPRSAGGTVTRTTPKAHENDVVPLDTKSEILTTKLYISSISNIH